MAAKKKSVKKIKTLIIDRKTWARGNISTSSLLNEENMKCCLGFAAEQICHASKKEILNMSTPGDVPRVFRRGLSWLIDNYNYNNNNNNNNNNNFSSDIAMDLMKINDDGSPTSDKANKSRESKIKRRFAKHGIIVKFIN
jgi:hypothetical protein